MNQVQCLHLAKSVIVAGQIMAHSTATLNVQRPVPSDNTMSSEIKSLSTLITFINGKWQICLKESHHEKDSLALKGDQKKERLAVSVKDANHSKIGLVCSVSLSGN